MRSFVLALILASAAPPAGQRTPNIVLIVLDTLRFDAVVSSMPFTTSLQSRSVVFDNAYSTHDFTPPSHFSLLTGFRDGLGGDLDRPELSVAHQLRSAGYDTFATLGNAFLTPTQMPTLAPFRTVNTFVTPASLPRHEDLIGEATDIDARLAMFRCRSTPRNRTMLYFSARRLLPMFLQQIRSARAPFFAFANLIDTHDPYVPDPEIYPPEATLPPNFSGDVMSRTVANEIAHPELIADPQKRRDVQDKLRIAGSPAFVAADLSPATLSIYRQRYLATARGLDASLATFFNALDEMHLLDNTIVILTSDHGESFGEGGLITHNFHDRGDYESTHHIPLIIVMPRTLASPRHLAQRVSIADVAPTIYDLAGVDWQPFARAFPSYARSLVPMFGSIPKSRAAVIVPAPLATDHSEAERERQRAFRALGYLQ